MSTADLARHGSGLRPSGGSAPAVMHGPLSLRCTLMDLRQHAEQGPTNSVGDRSGDTLPRRCSWLRNADLEASPWEERALPKVSHARLRVCRDIRRLPASGSLRLMREANNLLSPHRCRRTWRQSG